MSTTPSDPGFSVRKQQDDDATFYCDCSICDWEFWVREEWQGKVLSVLHVLHRHPEEYQATTGRDPDTAKFEYRSKLSQFRHML